MIDCPNPQDTTENVTETDCSILQQDCPPGTGCEPSGTTATHCVAGNGLKGPKAECKDGECKPGLRCVFGKCAPPCCAGNDAPCEGGACVVNFQITGNIAIRYCIYQESCDPFADMPCASAGEQCYPSILPYAFCAPPNPGPGGAGAPCPDGLLHCLGGHVCYSGTCRLACDLANYMSLEPGKGGCEAGDVCVTSTGITTVPGIGFCN